MKKERVFVMRMDERTMRILEELAKKNLRSKAGMVRVLINDYMKGVQNVKNNLQAN